MTDSVRLLIVEDHAMVADALTSMFAQAGGIDIVGVCGTGGEAITLAEQLQPHVVCMDNLLPDARGTDVSAEICQRWPTIKVVMLTASDDNRVLADAVQAGCVGFLTKGTSRAADLIDAIKRAALGEVVLPPSVVSRLLTHMRRGPRATRRGAGNHPDRE